MLPGKDLLELSVGDVIEAGPLFQGISDEPICFKLTARGTRRVADRIDREILTFEVWYHSIPIGEWACKVDMMQDDFPTTWMDVEAARSKR
jgi:hypothetical protein